jgi:hypothetical protein
MRISRFGLVFLPILTFFLGLLIGNLEGGLADASNCGSIALYLGIVGVAWVALERLARRHERAEHARNSDAHSAV